MTLLKDLFYQGECNSDSEYVVFILNFRRLTMALRIISIIQWNMTILSIIFSHNKNRINWEIFCSCLLQPICINLHVVFIIFHWCWLRLLGWRLALDFENNCCHFWQEWSCKTDTISLVNFGSINKDMLKNILSLI